MSVGDSNVIFHRKMGSGGVAQIFQVGPGWGPRTVDVYPLCFPLEHWNRRSRRSSNKGLMLRRRLKLECFAGGGTGCTS